MASSLINAPRGGETGGTINRILSNSRYLNTGGRQSFLGTSTATSFSLGKLEHAKLLQSALNGRMKGHTVPQQMSPPGGAPTYCWNDECSSGPIILWIYRGTVCRTTPGPPLAVG